MIKFKNSNLHKAKSEKNDEFYTQMCDIEKELQHYEDHFKDKVIYCNCDSKESNFYKYFINNGNRLGIKKLLRSGYNMETGGGDFRNKKCIEALKEADIVVTNPPFSLFREFISQMMEYDKKFLIIGNQNAITYKECFGLIRDGLMWFGINNNQSFVFRTPYENTLEDNIKFCKSKGYNDPNFVKVSAINWFTNLEHKKRNEHLVLYKTYNELEYPKYDNYDAINVNKVKEIPCDYEGVMGVPITFLNKWCPEQFDVLGQTHSGDESETMQLIKTSIKKRHGAFIKDKEIYMRILIKRK